MPSNDHDAPFDLGAILRKVQNRTRKRPDAAGHRTAAIEAAEAAAAFVRAPSWKLLDAFAEKERQWLALCQRPCMAYAPEFRRALKSGNYVRGQQGIKSAGSSRINIAIGYVYGAVTTDRPGWVKLGATSRHPTDRLAEFQRKYALRDITPIFFFEISDAHLAEAELHRRLYSRRVSRGPTDSREWFDMDPHAALSEVQTVILALGLRRWQTKYVHKHIATLGASMRVCHTLPAQHGGIVVSPNADRGHVWGGDTQLAPPPAQQPSPARNPHSQSDREEELYLLIDGQNRGARVMCQFKVSTSPKLEAMILSDESNTQSRRIQSTPTIENSARKAEQ